MLGWLLANGVWSAEAPRVNIVVDEKFGDIVEVAVAQWKQLANAAESIWGLEGSSRLLDPRMSVAINSSNDGAINVEIDPVAATYIAASQPVLGNGYSIRRACFPVSVGWTPWSAAKVARERIRPTKQPPEDALVHVLRRVFAKDRFRPGQLEAVCRAVTSAEALILFPTGYGKSLVFQMAAFVLPGVALVIEPYKSLLDDQARNLQDLGIGRIARLHSGQPKGERAAASGAADARLVYVAAERMHVRGFVEDLLGIVRKRGMSLFVIDEAHVVSQFGHSFRPAYLDLAERMDAICGKAGQERPTILALTATAAQLVIRDIQALLKIAGDPISLEELSSRCFVRENMSDEILHLNLQVSIPAGATKDEVLEQKRQSVLEQIERALKPVRTLGGQGIVFCPSKGEFNPTLRIPRRDDRTGKLRFIERPQFGASGIRDGLNQILKRQGVRIGLYHGGDDEEVKVAKAQDAADFSQGRIDIMVSTSAFGTGVDLPGVRWTLHVGMPAGLEAYYQESGRAGRDGSGARNVLLVDWDSDDVLEAMASARLDRDNPIESLQQALDGVKRRGSIARQLSLLIGDGPPKINRETIKDPVWKTRDDGEPYIARGQGGPVLAFMPSFPGSTWEIEHVDKPVHEVVLNGDRGRPIEIWCHQWWKDLVWKSVYRLALLGVVKHGFEHEIKKSEDTLVQFKVEVCDHECLSSERLIGRLEAEIAQFTSIERAREIREDLSSRLAAERDPIARTTQCSAALLKSVYRVVYETRIESLRSLARYAREPSLDVRREIIEDYFQPSDLKRQLFKLCREAATPTMLASAIQLAESQARWRSAIFERAATEFPGSVVPQLLLSLGGISSGDAKECARRVFQILADTSLTLEIRGWCFRQVVERARRAELLQPMLDGVAALMRDATSLDTLEVLVARLEDSDGFSGMGHLLVADFLSMAMETRR